MSVKKSATPEPITVNMVPMKDLYIGENIGRDQTLGLKGHTEESIRRLSFSIKEVGYVIQAITIGPKGYRDDNHKETPADKYPVLAGVGRVLAVNRLAQENSSDPRWKVIPARIQGEVDTKQAELISLHENAVRFAPTSLGWADGMARLSFMGKTDQQIAEMYAITPAEVSSYKLLRQLPASMRNLLNDSETNTGIWSEVVRKDGEVSNVIERTIEGKPIKFAKLRATFCMKLVRALNAHLKATKREGIPDEDKHAYLATVEAHWNKTGEWSGKPLEDRIVAEKAPAKPATPQAETPKGESATQGENKSAQTSGQNPPTSNGGVTPGNGKDGGMGRANQSGDPKEVKTVREAIDAKESAQPPQEFSIETRGAALWIGNHLSQPGMPPQLVEIGKRILAASWVYNAAKQTVMASDHKTALDDYIRNAFVETATTAATN